MWLAPPYCTIRMQDFSAPGVARPGAASARRRRNSGKLRPSMPSPPTCSSCRRERAPRGGRFVPSLANMNRSFTDPGLVAMRPVFPRGTSSGTSAPAAKKVPSAPAAPTPSWLRPFYHPCRSGGSLPPHVGIDAVRLGRLLRDDLPAFPVLAHVAEVARRVGKLKVRRRDRLAAVARAHGRLQCPGRQQRTLDGIGRLPLAEVMLNRVRQCLE